MFLGIVWLLNVQHNVMVDRLVFTAVLDDGYEPIVVEKLSVSFY